MLIMLSIWCHNKPFFKNYDLCPILWINFSHMFEDFMHAHRTIFFSSFPTWRFHSHFIKIKYMTRGPNRNYIVCFCSLLHFSPYSNNPPYLCSPFVGRWYTYSRSNTKCGSYFFMITTWIFNIWAFNVANEVCNLVSIQGRPLYITYF